MGVGRGAGSGVMVGIFLDFLSLKLFCVLSLESPHGGDSNEYTKYTIFNITRKIDLNYLKAAAMGFSWGHRRGFEAAVVGGPSVFEPLGSCCILFVYIYYVVIYYV